MAIVAIGLWCTSAGLGAARAQSDTGFQPTWYMVVDWANLLDERQELSAINDAWRLNLLGVPAQVVTELEESTPELARQRAEALRIEHGIESAPGAEDGILIYAAVNPYNRSLVTMAIAAGPRSLPDGGLTSDNLADIESNIVVPQLTAEHPARAIVYAVREMIYQQVFTPPPSSPPSGLRASLEGIMPWLAPVVAIPVAIGTLHNSKTMSGISKPFMQVAPPLVSGLVLAVAAIGVRSAPGTFWAIGLILLSIGVLTAADRQRQPSVGQAPAVNPLPPTSLTSIAKASS
jgi:hypothetical protein